MGRRRRRTPRASKAGLPPGAPVYVGNPHDEPVAVHVIDYGPDRHVELDTALPEELWRLAVGRSVTWINVDGVHDARLVEQVCRPFGVDALWVEDILNATGRPKIEVADGMALIIARAVRWIEEERAVDTEHHAFLLGSGWIVSFQERPGDPWNPLRDRIRAGATRVRRMPVAYLLHGLLDAVVDEYLGVLDRVETRVEDLEDAALAGTARDVPMQLAALKGDLAQIRGAVWPLRDALPALTRDLTTLSNDVRPYLSDLRDHLEQTVEHVEHLRDRLVSAFEIHTAVQSQALNETMRMLTVVSTLFIPLTFIVGVYGMNFDVMPELHWSFGYAVVWSVMIIVTSGMIAWFRRKGWL